MTDAVEIPVADAELIRAALNSAYHHSVVLDLAEQYRRLTQRPQTSKLSQSLENALALIQVTLDQAASTEVTADEHQPS